MPNSKENSGEWHGEERRKKNSFFSYLDLRPFSKLKKKMLIYFFLIAFVSLIVGLEMVWEIGEPKLVNQIAENFIENNPEVQLTESMTKEIFQPLEELQIRMLLLLFIVALCITVTLIIYIRNIANPLDDMLVAAKSISEGNLATTVPVSSDDEIGQLGEIYNDLAVNFQEALLFVGAVNSELGDLLNEMEGKDSAKKDDNDDHIIQIKERVHEELRDLVQSFDYYNVIYDGEHVEGNESEQTIEKVKDHT